MFRTLVFLSVLIAVVYSAFIFKVGSAVTTGFENTLNARMTAIEQFTR